MRTHPWVFPIPRGRADPVQPVEVPAHKAPCGRRGNPPRRPHCKPGQDVVDEKVSLPARRTHDPKSALPVWRPVHESAQASGSSYLAARHDFGSEMPSYMRHPIYSRPFNLKTNQTGEIDQMIRPSFGARSQGVVNHAASEGSAKEFTGLYSYHFVLLKILLSDAHREDGCLIPSCSFLPSQVIKHHALRYSG